MRVPPLALVLAVLIGGCDAPAEHPSLTAVDWPPLLQAHRFAHPGASPGAYQLSPDGRKLAWIGSSLARSTLFVRDNTTGEVRKFRAHSAGFTWAPDGRRLLYVSDTSGTENAHVYVLDTDDAAAQPVDLTPYPGVKAGIHQIPSGDPGRILVYHNRRDRKLFDLYRIDLATRAETLVARNPGDGIAPVTEIDGSFKGWKTAREAKRPPALRGQPLAVRRPVLAKKPDESFQLLGMNADRTLAWALSDRGRDRVALVAVDPTLGWEKVVFEDPVADVSRVTMSRVTRDPLIAAAQPGYPRVEILDAKLRADLDPLLKEQGDARFGVEIVSTDDSESRLIVCTYTSTQRRCYFVDRKTRHHVLLAQAVPDELAASLAPMEPVEIESRDGLRLHGYLTLPRGIEPKRLPMVLLVHGGPWMRTGWSDPLHTDDPAHPQFLANRGYAVLQVNYRGSTGYGQSLQTAGMGEFAGRMHDDLLDATRWAVDRGIADPRRVAIAGWSYGGYAALIGLAKTPDVFACGISVGGPTDLPSLIESFPPYWTNSLSMWHDYVGDPRVPEDRAEMQRKSPLTYVRDVRRPVLIVHGAKDVRVRIDQSERMVQALRSAGKEVEYLPIPDMGHGLGWWVHRLTVLRRTEAFLQRCLGGRASRFDPLESLAWVWARIQR